MDNTLLSTISMPELVDLYRATFPGLNRNALIELKAASLFLVDSIGKGQGNSRLYREMDTETFASAKPEGSAAKKTKAGLGYSKIVYKRRFGTEISVTQEMWDENRYREVGTELTSLAHFIPQRRELDITHIFTFCNAANYVDRDGVTVDLRTPDGLPLIHTAHLRLGTPITFSNKVVSNAPFGMAGLEEAEEIATTQIISHYGEKRVLKFNTIVTGDNPTIVNAVEYLMKSKTKTDQANEAVISVYAGKYDHTMLPYLATTATGAADSTKKNIWFLVAKGKWQAYVLDFEPTKMTDATEDPSLRDGHRDIWSFSVRGSYGIGVASPVGIIASLAV